MNKLMNKMLAVLYFRGITHCNGCFFHFFSGLFAERWLAHGLSSERVRVNNENISCSTSSVKSCSHSESEVFVGTIWYFPAKQFSRSQLMQLNLFIWPLYNWCNLVLCWMILLCRAAIWFLYRVLRRWQFCLYCFW